MENDGRNAGFSAGGRRGRAGFTMVELLTVITIIGILVGILVPVVMLVRNKAHVHEAGFTLNQLALGLKNMKDYYRYDDLLGKDADGILIPEEIKIDLELDPFNRGFGWNGENEPPGWPKHPGWAPHLNLRVDGENPSKKICKRFYEAKRSRIVHYRLVDPWGNPYVYDIVTRSQDLNGDGADEDIDIELLICVGYDGVKDTDDDIVHEGDRMVRPEEEEIGGP